MASHVRLILFVCFVTVVASEEIELQSLALGGDGFTVSKLIISKFKYTVWTDYTHSAGLLIPGYKPTMQCERL